MSFIYSLKMKQFFCLFLVGVVSTCSGHFGDFGYESSRLLQQCRNACRLQNISLSELAARQSPPPCFVKCVFRGFMSKAVNSNTTNTASTPTTVKLRYSSTTPSLVKPATTVKVDNNDCPRNYFPLRNETVPGDVSNVDVTFEQQMIGSQWQWVAEVTWTPPKGCNISSNWRGYLVIWASDSDSSDSDIRRARCQKVLKNQTKFVIKRTDGWKYPNTLYITVVALPSMRQAFEMEDFSPIITGQGVFITYAPAKLKGPDTVFTSFLSWKGVALLGSALLGVGLIVAFIVLVWRAGKARAAKVMNKTDDISKKQLILDPVEEGLENKTWKY